MKNKGFTLIELMLVVAIIGVLAAIAIPNFSKYIRESKRTEAIVALNEVQQAQAKLRVNCRWYAESLASANNCDAASAADSVVAVSNSQGNGEALTESSYYTIAITAGSASGNAYTATATPVATGAQSYDTTCWIFTLTVDATNPNGLKSAEDDAGNDTTSECW